MTSSLARRALAEAIGTFFLVLIGAGSVVVDARTAGTLGVAGVALAFAFVVTAMIYALGHVSGAHLNPAVTFGLWSVRRFPGMDVPAYVVMQCFGAIAAALALRAALGSGEGLGATVPALPSAAAFGVEWLLTFALVMVVTAVATDERVADGTAGLAVGLTVGFDALMGGPLTGASMNPARSLGPALVSGVWTSHWIYWLAPLSAAAVAVRVYEVLRPAGAPALVPRGVPIGVQGPLSGLGRERN